MYQAHSGHWEQSGEQTRQVFSRGIYLPEGGDRPKIRKGICAISDADVLHVKQNKMVW